MKLQLYLPWSLALNLALLKARLLCAHGNERLSGELNGSSPPSRAADLTATPSTTQLVWLW